jgi:hypothetical protein
MLDQDEAAALAGLLDELGARDRQYPLSALALRTAALLRQRAGVRQQGVRPGPVGPPAVWRHT